MDEPRQSVQPLSVSQLTQLIKQSLEAEFTSVWVVGELSDVARPQSGHVYLTLKDEGAQIRGVIWRSVASRLGFDLEDGQQVVCGGDLDVYPPRKAGQRPFAAGIEQALRRQPLVQLAQSQLQRPDAQRLNFADDQLIHAPRRIDVQVAAADDLLAVLQIEVQP